MVQAAIAGALIGAMLVGGAKLAAKNETKDVYAFGASNAIVETAETSVPADAPDVTE